MRLLCLFVLAVCAASFYSCTDSEEPMSPLIGVWENRVYVDSIDYWIVETYDFVNDSTYDITVTVRESEMGNDLGYRFVSRGWYDLQADNFQYYYSYALMIENHFVASINADKVYAPKEELMAIVIDFFRKPTANLTFSSDRKQFEFLDECLDIMSECPSSKTYIKVD